MYALLLQTTDGQDWPTAIIAVGSIAMITIIVSVAIWQVLASWRARMSIAREDAYRKLADQSVAAQERLADQQSRMADDLASVNDRVARIEKLLKDVG